MKPIRWATFALLAGSVGLGAAASAYAQPPGDPFSWESPPSYDRVDDRDRHDYRDDDRGYDRYDGRDGYGAPPRAEVGFFYDELSPYGDWVRTPDYGWAWFPRDVHPYWRPYSEGRWVTTEYGWTWVSTEPFGWATYHYGRWAWDPRFGWLWVPGTVWGPAWVSWQHGGGYVGWAPLPPSVGFEIGIGLRLGGFDLNIGIRPDAYSFVQERSFLETRLSGHLVPRARNVTIIHNTTNITNYTYVDNRVVNRGVEVRRIEQATGRRVRPVRVAEARGKTRTEVAQSELRIYRPERRQLESVRVGPPRDNARRRAETPPANRRGDRSPAEPDAKADFEVAPRAVPAPVADARRLEQRERRAAQELQRYQAQEQRQLERRHGQEVAGARTSATRNRVERNHQAEREALRQEQVRAGQQLEERQKAQRRAAHANPQPKDDENPKADPPAG